MATVVDETEVPISVTRTILPIAEAPITRIVIAAPAMDVEVSAGTPLWMDPAPADIEFSAAGNLPVRISAPPGEVEFSSYGSLPVAMPAAPMDIEVSAYGSLPLVVTAPYMSVHCEAKAGSAVLVRSRTRLADPANAAVVPVVRPTFTVRSTLLRGRVSDARIDVRYFGDDGHTTTPTRTISTGFVMLTGVNSVRLTATEDLSPGYTYSWQARLVADGAQLGWSSYRSFTVDPAAGAHSIPLTWSVTDEDTEPELWHVFPDTGHAGDEITLVGQGFPTSNLAVKIRGVDCPIQRFGPVPATAAASTPARTVDPLSNRVDVQHDEIVVLIPEFISPPGGPIWVQGD